MTRGQDLQNNIHQYLGSPEQASITLSGGVSGFGGGGGEVGGIEGGLGAGAGAGLESWGLLFRAPSTRPDIVWKPKRETTQKDFLMNVSAIRIAMEKGNQPLLDVY